MFDNVILKIPTTTQSKINVFRQAWQVSYQALESDDLLALLALAEHGVAQLAEDGRLELVVDDEGLLGGILI